MAPHEIVVFLGPSLPVAEARRILPARYLAPARCGDLLRVRRMRPRAVAIIDGVFESVGAVWHKEILLALEDGIAVYGAASMGAIRAAELAPFGMVGIGAIFEAYRDGVYVDDDEVALLQGPAAFGYPAMSEAMVNVRATAASAVASGVLTPASADRLLRCAKDTFYQDRSFDGLIEQAWGPDPDNEAAARFRRFLDEGGRVNQKRADAEALLRSLATRSPTAPSPLANVPTVHRSSFILRLQHESMCGPFDVPDADLPREEHVAAAAARLGNTFAQLRRLSQLLAVAYALARGRDLTVTNADRARVFRRDALGLGSAARTGRWARARDLDARTHAGLVERLSVVHALRAAFERRVGRREARRRYDARLLDLMRLDGRYPARRAPGAGSGPSRDHATLQHVARRGGLAFALDRCTGVLWTLVDDILASLRAVAGQSPQVLSDEFRRARGLELRGTTLTWRRANNLDERRYEALVARDARLAMLCRCDDPHALGLHRLAEPVCWLLDAVRLSGVYGRLQRGLCYGVRHSEFAAHLSWRDMMAKAKAAKKAVAKKAPAKKTAAKATVKDLKPKDTKSVKGGALARKKVFE